MLCQTKKSKKAINDNHATLLSKEKGCQLESVYINCHYHTSQ
jgi:hypothetical protein